MDKGKLELSLQVPDPFEIPLTLQSPFLSSRTPKSSTSKNLNTLQWFQNPKYDYFISTKSDNEKKIIEWRPKDKMRTVSVLIVLCLNIGVDPPDVFRSPPYAKLEAGVDPFYIIPATKAIEAIGNNLQSQYERWQSRARYKQIYDPTFEELRKLALSQRRQFHDERCLVHFNGHGVPIPTAAGEIWVFNKSFTQYIPLSFFDLHNWISSPAMYVLDCNGAGCIIDAFSKIVKNDASCDAIILAACSAGEYLPTNPIYPADIFTSCLTTPVEISLKIFTQRSILTHFDSDILDKIPGRHDDRKSPFGELTWIFAAITDTIAWNLLSIDVFQKFFRQDLLVASLFRQYLLAIRILSSLNCTPQCYPSLGISNSAVCYHPMWKAWDLALESTLAQLEIYLKNPEEKKFEHNSFFHDQLTAFEVWLLFATSSSTSASFTLTLSPFQLPVVLQLMLSQTHRHRALILLAYFLDINLNCVNISLSLGIFPYILKLLQSAITELRPILVFIWAKILNYDYSCSNELINNNEFYQYFINHLSNICSINNYTPNKPFMPANLLYLNYLTETDSIPSTPSSVYTPVRSPNGNSIFQEVPKLTLQLQRIICLYILAVISYHNQNAQDLLLKNHVLSLYLNLANSSVISDPLFRQWICICIGNLISNETDSFYNMYFQNSNFVAPFNFFFEDPYPEVRAASLFMVRQLWSPQENIRKNEDIFQKETKKTLPNDVLIGSFICNLIFDGNSTVRMELLLSLMDLVNCHLQFFLQAFKEFSVQTLSFNSPASKPFYLGNRIEENFSSDETHLSQYILKHLYFFTIDPFEIIASTAKDFFAFLGDSLNSSLVRSTSFSSLSTGNSTHPFKTVQSEINLDKTNNVDEDTKIRKVNSITSNLYHLPSISMLMKSVGGGGGILGMRKTLSNNPAKKDSSSSLPPKKNVLPSFFEWSSQYFSQNLLSNPPSNPSPEEIWRCNHNSNSISKMNQLTSSDADEQMKKSLQLSAFDQTALFAFSASSLLFHPFENILIGGNKKPSESTQNVVVWNFDEGTLINSFNNSTPYMSPPHFSPEADAKTNAIIRSSGINSLHLINDLHVALLMTTTVDGIVRIWKNFHVKDGQSLVAAWSPCPFSPSNMQIPSHKSSFDAGERKKADSSDSVHDHRPRSSSFYNNTGIGLVTDWQQSKGHLICSKNDSIIKIWDVNYEKCINEIHSFDNCFITSFTSRRNGNILVAGFNDRSVCLFDLRNPPQSALISCLQEHRGPILKVVLQRNNGDDGLLVSGDVTGDIILSDLRVLSSSRSSSIIPSVTKISAHQNSSMSALAVHDYLPIIATGSYKQFIKVFETTGRPISMIQYHEGFLGQRIGPVNTLAFHPLRHSLASGSLDSFVSLYEGRSHSK